MVANGDPRPEEWTEAMLQRAVLGAPVAAFTKILADRPWIRGPEWQLRCVSTPGSIYGALQGAMMMGRAGYESTLMGLNGERSLAARAKRRDLLPPMSGRGRAA